MDDADLVIVGGGITGGALATVMAREGARVLVLERQSRYRDHVRGELLWPWGVQVARELGIESVLLDAGALVVRWLEDYDEGSVSSTRNDVGALVDGVRGSINLTHPAACAALVGAATSAGADVRTGVRTVHVAAGERPSVRWLAENGDAHEARPRVVVGADGRRSSVRSQAGVSLEVDPPAHLVTGLLVEASDGLDTNTNVTARESDLLFLAFPQDDGRARLYHCFPTEQRGRFAGRDASERFLDATALRCMNGGAGWRRARPAGPCASFPAADSRAPVPLAEGVVLIGDAAGYENPLRGQGLAMAFQDVHEVSRALLSASPLPEALGKYVDARAGRHRLTHLATDLSVWANDGFRAQDPEQRAARREHIRGDAVLAALGRSFVAGYDALPQELTATDLAARLVTGD